MIHSTAAVDARAELGAHVSIGPFAVVEGGARIGDGCVIHAHAVIGAHVTMGAGNVIGHGAVLGGDPQDFAFQPTVQSEVRIGDGNRIREHCTIHRGTAEGSATVVGNRCFLMAGAHLGHNVQLGDDVVIANNSLLGGYVVVEDRVFIGGASVFHQFVRVGRLVICQGASGFSKNIPPFTLAVKHNLVAGLNVVGLRRAGFTPEQRRELKQAFDLLFRSGRNVSQALAAAAERTWSPEAQSFFTFAAEAGKRGLCAWIGAAGGEDAADR